MKILQLGKFYPIRGGVEKVMRDLTEGLGRRGVSCNMLCACMKEDMPQGGEIRLNDNARIICVRAFAKVAATMMAPGMITRLRRMLRSGGYDIVHVHHPDPMAALALFLSGWKGPVILHWHSDIIKQKGLLKLFLPLQKWLVRRAYRIVGTSEVYLRESPYLTDCQDRTVCIPIGVEALPEGIDVDTEGKTTVFSLGRLVPYKGFIYLIRAAQFLPDNYRVVIGGSGPLMGELESEIDRLSLRGKVRLLGYLTDEEAHGWFHACDVYCLSSIMKTEAYAIVQVEAMSCGKPVVATEIPGSGVPWVNESGTSGMNVPVCDPQALAAAVMEVTGNDRQRYADGARNRYMTMFTYEKMIDNCIRLYNETEQGFQA